MNPGQAAEDLEELSNRPVGVHFQANHLAQHGDAHLKSHSGEKPYQHSLRQKVGQEAELQYSGQQQKSGGEQSDRRCQRHISRACDGCHTLKLPGKNGSGR